MEQRSIQTAVVTGATGVLGLALCERLLQNGCTVYAVCRPDSPRTARLDPLRQKGLQIVSCDMAGYSALPQKIPGGADALFHLAWGHTMGAGRDDTLAQNANVRYTIEIIGAAKALGCHTFVGAGSQAEYGRCSGILKPETPCFPETGYGAAKLCAGQLGRIAAKQLGICFIWPRVLSLYGPGDNENAMAPSLLRALLAKQRPALTPGEQLWDYLYAADAANAFWLMARHGRDGAVYPLGSGQAMPLRRYAELLRDAVDPALPLGLGEVPYAPNQVMHLQADISALQRDVGFAPEITFAKGAALTAAWYQNNKKPE